MAETTIYTRTNSMLGDAQKPMIVYLAQGVLATGTTKNPRLVRPELVLLDQHQLTSVLQAGRSQPPTTREKITDQRRAGLWQQQLDTILRAVGIEYQLTTNSNIANPTYFELQGDGQTLEKPYGVQPYSGKGPTLREPMVVGYQSHPAIILAEGNSNPSAEVVVSMLMDVFNAAGDRTER
jgi:hypothetical protein